MFLSRSSKKNIIRALEEDDYGCDLTTSTAIAKNTKAKAVITAKQSGVLCGIEIAKFIFIHLDKKTNFKILKKDGYHLRRGQQIAFINGKASAIVTAERTALNFLSLLSGVSTTTSKFVDKVNNRKVRIMDTRKTTPNLRELEKYAVKVGGGYNHRTTLSKGIIIKDNHLKAAKCVHRGRVNAEKIQKLVTSFRRKTKLPLEIEVENLTEFREVAKCKPDIIMLDNFPLKAIKAAVTIRNKCFPEVKLDASGGIRLNNVKKVADQGVDFISVGMITHSVGAIDFSLNIT